MEHDPDVAAVVVGFDRNVNYYKIQYATLCIRENRLHVVALADVSQMLELAGLDASGQVELYDGRSHAERSARTDRGHEASRTNLGRAAGVESGGVADIEGRAAGMVGLGGDDCSTEEERRRFERLGPIRAEQLAGLDVDELLRQFEA